MARPLKISKAQAVLTITATTVTTNIVTVSQSLSTAGVIRGMPFIPATTVGGLTGGTTYWVLQVLSDFTFLASATTVDANATYTPVTLTTTSGQTVAATVGLIGTGFNNPNGSANTYGVVGGNTAFYGNQVLANVAIGREGVGTIYASTTSNVIGGVGTNLGNVAINSVIEVDGQVLGRVSANTGSIVSVITDTAVDGNITVDDAAPVVVGLPITITANVGNLIAGTSYLVSTVDDIANVITVTTLTGSAVTLTLDGPVTVNAVQNLSTFAANASANVAGTSFVYSTPEAGYIVRQKGKTKYLVTGSTSGATAACFTVNSANTALTANTMVITGTTAGPASVNVKSINDYNSEIFPTVVDAANLVPATQYTIYNSGDTDWTEVGAYANMTGITFVASAAGTGTGTAVVANVNPDFYATFNTAAVANTAAGIPNPVITINKA